ncbi:NAD(P)-binding protein [Sodiomyces alkalinus F11]|uniref:NAD(P)-binding protein n=1 Tax=Sodiomyces alkalinus (strain CBS 110278 / VKM F-3762 / F11) TaxID=1314773 RepID=A0A3N2PU43_SODAK|nr:NAD(P)-binding protein [Sodiomyces alkalinus F11]ROT38027.1 NAD(P)-binding protein [Sodiomyces alkalinus F11]
MAPPYDTNTTADELVNDFAAEIKGKVVLTTGVTPGGLGAVFVETVAKAQPALLILASRNVAKTQETADAITSSHPNVAVRVLQLDLVSPDSVREAASKLNGWDDVPSIDVLVNNAAVMATDYAVTPEGIERQFATNHLGHFLFTNLIMGKILKSASPRVVSVSSSGHRMSPIRWGDLNFDKDATYNGWQAYGQSKTANILFAISLAEKLGPKGLLALSVHPGVIFTTGLGTHLDFAKESQDIVSIHKRLGNPEAWTQTEFISAERGTATHVFAAFAPSLKDHNGAYLLDSRVADPFGDEVMAWATSKIEAERLWKLSEKLVGQKFSF